MPISVSSTTRFFSMSRLAMSRSALAPRSKSTATGVGWLDEIRSSSWLRATLAFRK